MTLVLDTNAYSDWRQRGRWNDLISRADRVLVPAVVLGELRAGFRMGGRAAENERKLMEFLREPLVGVAEIGEVTSLRYAEIKDQLRRAGTLIPENDVWIAAVAAEHGALLVTGDGHFSLLPQVARAVEG